MMTVDECISQAKSSSSAKISRLWICPEIVNNGKVGKNYVYRGAIEYKVSSQLGAREVKKHWIEEGCLCIVYKANNDPLIFSS